MIAWLFTLRFRCVTITPLGREVLPDVNWRNARSSRLTGGGSGAEPSAALGEPPSENAACPLKPAASRTSRSTTIRVCPSSPTRCSAISGRSASLVTRRRAPEASST